MMKALKILLIIILFASAIWTVICYFAPYEVDETVIAIKKGSNAHKIANILEAENVIRNRLLFNLYIRLHHVDQKLSYGKYLFRGSMTISDVVEVLTSAKVILKPLTIPEGLTLQQTSQLLAAKGLGDYDTYMELCTDSLFASSILGMSVNTLEGFLYPETYHLPEEASEEYILKILVREFKKGTEKLDFGNDKLDLYSTIVLASIVEKEAHHRDEYPRIAGVYLNRLADKHRLQADPTVAYVLARRGIKRRKIYYKDLRIDSPYNTYKYTGLPPGPICSPGFSAIESVVSPENTDYYFFFAGNNGRHEFSKTYHEHLRKQSELKKLNASR